MSHNLRQLFKSEKCLKNCLKRVSHVVSFLITLEYQEVIEGKGVRKYNRDGGLEIVELIPLTNQPTQHDFI